MFKIIMVTDIHSIVNTREVLSRSSFIVGDPENVDRLRN